MARATATYSHESNDVAKPAEAGPHASWSEEQIIQHIEAVSREMTMSTNDRIFDINHPIFALVSPHYRCEGLVVERPGHASSAHEFESRTKIHPTNSRRELFSMDLATVMSVVEETMQSLPDHKVRVVDTSTAVDVKHGIAHVFVKCIFEGGVKGAGRSFITNMKWKRFIDVEEANQEQWLLVHSKAMSGVEMGMPLA